MNILVTGGAGYIGSHAAKALAAAGHRPVVFDNLRTGHRAAVRYGPFEYGDVAELPRLAEVMVEHRIEAVMHFAALSTVGESTAAPQMCWRVNVGGLLNVLAAMRATGVARIVFSSTCAIYAAASAANVLTEDSLRGPVSPYGRSKLSAEEVLADCAPADGIAAVALRYFNAAGADPAGELGEAHDPETHLVPLVLAAAAGQRPALDVFGLDYATADGTCVRDYVHVSDLAAAHVAALGVAEPGRLKAYNLGTGTGFSVREVIATAERVTGRPVPWRPAPRRPGDPAILVADPALARAELAFPPPRPLEEIVATAWNWHRGRNTF